MLISHLQMRLNLIIVNATPMPANPAGTTNNSPAPRKHDPRVIDSRELFGQHAEVRLRHGNEEYRLRITRQGKLILTK